MSSTEFIKQNNFGAKVLNENQSNDNSTYKKSVVVQRKISSEPCGVQQKSVLLYLVRMGSFQSPNPKMPPKDNEDEHVNLDEIESVEQMKKFCFSQLPSHHKKLLKRKFIAKKPTINWIDSDDSISIMQWNLLSQAMGYHYEKFESCNEEEMEWSVRKWKIVLELLQYNTVDVICLQEVDHFDFLMDILEKIGYEGKFLPKPDSPCYYISNNTGPDGCAVFWKTSKLTLISASERVLEVYQCKSNQVVLSCQFELNTTGQKFCVATTHLKARKGPILSAIRNEQGKDLLNFLLSEYNSLPIILTGDFNAEPTEPVYNTMRKNLSSAYFDGLNQEPSFTNWTKRENEIEMKRTLDYIFYSKSDFELISLLLTESSELSSPIPNVQYPSDHLSLLARFKIHSF